MYKLYFNTLTSRHCEVLNRLDWFKSQVWEEVERKVGYQKVPYYRFGFVPKVFVVALVSFHALISKLEVK